MKFCPWIVALLWVYIGTNAQELDLFDALAPDPTPAVPVKPKPDEPKKPAGGDSGGLDLLDAFDEGPASTPEKPEKPKKPSGGGGGFELDLGDALGPDDPTPEKPAVKPPRGGGGGGSFDDSDLEELGGGGEYKPDGGRSGGSGGRAQGPGAAGDNPQAEAGTGQIAGIASAIGMALVGAASSYFAYQKKKLCFKLQGGADPESGKDHRGAQSDPQVLSDLLKTQS